MNTTATLETTFPKFLTLDEVGTITRVDVTTVRKWVLGGKFPNYRRVGKAYLVPESDLRAALER